MDRREGWGGRGTDADVIVVGAGPAGSATALLLARWGHRVLMVDRARFPRSKPCGEYLNPGAVAALDRLGVLAGVAAGGVTLAGMFIAGPDGASVWAPFPTGSALLVPREHLDEVLVRAAARAGAELIEECRVDAVERAGADAVRGGSPLVAARCGGRTLRLRARLVVGADGIRSVVARRAGPLATDGRGHYTVGAHFEALQSAGPRGDLHLGPGWYAGAALYGGGRGNVVAAVPRDWFARAGRDPEQAFTAACEALPALRILVRGARRVTPFVTAGPLGFVRRRAVDDGLLLVGDAAGTVNPMTGQGIALALRGAELAAEAADAALQRGDCTRRALAAYERARWAAFLGTWSFSRLLQWTIRRPGLATALVRRLAANPALAVPLLGAVSGPRPVAVRRWSGQGR